jgi:hypothetical protein
VDGAANMLLIGERSRLVLTVMQQFDFTPPFNSSSGLLDWW